MFTTTITDIQFLILCLRAAEGYSLSYFPPFTAEFSIPDNKVYLIFENLALQQALWLQERAAFCDKEFSFTYMDNKVFVSITK